MKKFLLLSALALSAVCSAQAYQWVAVDSSDNLWNNAKITNTFWWADANWSQIADPGFKAEGNAYTWSVTTAPGSNQWQAQTFFNTDIAVSAAKKYDIKAVFESNKAINAATFKWVHASDDGSFLTDGRINILEGETVVELISLNGIDTDGLRLVIDLAGIPAETTLTMRDVIVQESINEKDPVVIPEGLSLASCWWATENWAQIAAPTVEITDGVATITVNEANGPSQWQGQVHFNTGKAITEGNTYDFSITLKASQDINGVTVKPHPDGDDGHFLSENRHDIKSDTETVIAYEGVKADFSTTNLVLTLDFPSCAKGTVITVKDLVVNDKNGSFISDIAADKDGEAEYYDLNGRRVINPVSGVYIVRKGSAVSKHFIR